MTPDLAHRLPEGTSQEVVPDIMSPSEMLPSPDDLRKDLENQAGLDSPTETELKLSSHRQADLLSQWMAGASQRSRRHRAAGRTMQAWWYIKHAIRRTMCHRRIDMVLWQDRAILSCRETLRQVYDDQVALRGRASRIADHQQRHQRAAPRASGFGESFRTGPHHGNRTHMHPHILVQTVVR